jgi:hypothetical protein
MPTLLTTRKMDPALAGRVMTSVARRGLYHGTDRRSTRNNTLFRLFALAGAVALVAAIVVSRQRSAKERGRAQAALLAAVDGERRGTPSADLEFPAKVQAFVDALRHDYRNDVITPQGRAVVAELGRHALVYVRGPLDGFSTRAAIGASAAASGTESFVTCLLDPPPSRDERSILRRVRRHAADPGTAATSNIIPLHSVWVGLPLLSEEWAARVRAADDDHKLRRLRAELAGVRIPVARAGLQAPFFLVVLDEPSSSSAVTELDGTRPRPVRIGLFDVEKRTPLFMLRRQLEVDWISPALRAEHASGLSYCALALGVRSALDTEPAPTAP